MGSGEGPQVREHGRFREVGIPQQDPGFGEEAGALVWAYVV